MRYQTRIILSAAFILLFSLVFQVNTQDHFYLQLISFDKSSNIYERLKGLELDFLMEWERKIYALAAPEILLQLEYKGISYSLASLPGNQFPTQFSSLSSINGAYHSYGELERDLKQLSDSYPQICSLISLGTSLENRNIYALKISDNVAIEENEARVLFLGCHHAREWISVEIPFLIAKHLVENYHSNPAIKNLVDRAEIWFVPMVNPDGLEYSIHFYRYWRKNRRTHGNGQFGVDLNRNYSYQWGYDNSGSSPDPSSDVYRGKSAFSEPESFAVKKLGEQTTFHALISYHSYSQVILYPWGYTTQQAPGKTLMESLASKMSEAMEKVNGRKYSWGQTGSSLYLTNGDTTDWIYGNFGIPAFTIELPPVDLLRGGFFNAESDIQLIFEENLPAALILIEWTTETFNESILNQAERLKDNPFSEIRVSPSRLNR